MVTQKYKDWANQFLKEVERDPQKYTQQYLSQFGNNVCIDNALELFPGYKNGTLVERAGLAYALGKPTKVITDRAYQQLLDKPSEPGRGDSVLFVMGGMASGKSSGIQAAFKKQSLEDVNSRHSVIYESIVGLNTKKVEQALNAGKKIDFLYVYRPAEQAVGAMAERAKTQGRFATLPFFAQGHYLSPQRFIYFAEKYGINQKGTVQVFENANYLKPPSEKDVNWLKNNLPLSEEMVKQKAQQGLNKYYDKQREQDKTVPRFIREGIKDRSKLRRICEENRGDFRKKLVSKCSSRTSRKREEGEREQEKEVTKQKQRIQRFKRTR